MNTSIRALSFVSPVPRNGEIPYEKFKEEAERLAKEKGIQLAGQDELDACLANQSLLAFIPEAVEVLVFIPTEFFRKDCFVMKDLYRGRGGWKEYCIIKDDRHFRSHIHVACF